MNQLLEPDAARQAEERLRGLVAGLALGSRLPPERELAVDLGLGRTVLRTVLMKLTAEGWLERRQGAGTFVARTPGSPVATGLSEELSRRGVAFEVLVLDVARVPAPAHTGLGGDVVEVRRARGVGGETVSLKTTWLPGAWAVGLDVVSLSGASLYGLLARHGDAPRAVAERLAAVIADADTAARLGVPEGSPLLEVGRVARAEDGRVVEVSRTRLRADRFHLRSSADDRHPGASLAALLTITPQENR